MITMYITDDLEEETNAARRPYSIHMIYRYWYLFLWQLAILTACLKKKVITSDTHGTGDTVCNSLCDLQLSCREYKY